MENFACVSVIVGGKELNFFINDLKFVGLCKLDVLAQCKVQRKRQKVSYIIEHHRHKGTV